MINTPDLHTAAIIEKPSENKYKGYIQLKDGEIIGHFATLKGASEATGITEIISGQYYRVKESQPVAAYGFMLKYLIVNWVTLIHGKSI